MILILGVDCLVRFLLQLDIVANRSEHAGSEFRETLIRDGWEGDGSAD